NVDRAIEELVALWQSKVGDGSAIIVTADHGEALFENGVLGHGLALDETQTRVPLILSGLGGEWPEPFGLCAVRASRQRALEEESPNDSPPRARFVRPRGRRILQYMAVVERPRFLCLRALDGELRYDTTQREPPTDSDFTQLVYWWEAEQLR